MILNFNKNLFRTFFYLLFVFSFCSTFNTTLAQNGSSTQEVAKFPYKINFSESELQLLNSLDIDTLTKLLALAKTLYESHLSNLKALQNNKNNTTTIPSSDNNGQQNSNSNNTGNQQNTPRPNNISSNGTQQSNSFYGSGQTGNSNLIDKYFPASPADNTQSISLIESVNSKTTADFKNTFPESGKGSKCENFGTVNNMGGRTIAGPEGLSAKLKWDLSRLCQLTGKRLVLTSGRRGNGSENATCAGTSQHNCGKAIDTALKPYSEDEQTVVTLYFMAHGYAGIGSYGSGPMHFDHRSSSMRWGPPGPPFRYANCKASAYYPSVQKAFSLVGVKPCILLDKNLIRARAIQVLKQMGKEDFTIDAKLSS